MEQRDQHLTVPSPNSSPQQSPPQNATLTGRPRSGSQRSQRSQHSTETPDTADRRDFDRRPSIRIRRAPSQQPLPQPSNADNGLLPVPTEGYHVGGRSRSNSAPQQLGAAGGSQRRSSYMPEVAEETTSPTTGSLQAGIASLPAATDFNALADVEAGNGGQEQVNQASVSSWRPLRRARTNIGRTGESSQLQEGAEYDAELVDILDLVGKRTPPRLVPQTKHSHYRSRSPGPSDSNERPKLPCYSVSGEVSE